MRAGRAVQHADARIRTRAEVTWREADLIVDYLTCRQPGHRHVTSLSFQVNMKIGRSANGDANFTRKKPIGRTEGLGEYPGLERVPTAPKAPDRRNPSKRRQTTRRGGV